MFYLAPYRREITLKEKHYRSVIKGITWRAIGTADTVFLSWLFTGSIGNALSIGGIELFTKITLFYIHERVWMRLSWARESWIENGVEMFKERHVRSVVKGISWRVTGTLDTITIAFFVTHDYKKALTIGFAEVFTKVGLYYLHERAWMRTNFGRHAPAAVQPSDGEMA